MKTKLQNRRMNMNEYTRYCTEKQTKIAHSLGAPIDVSNASDNKNIVVKDLFDYGINGRCPSQEQLREWLRTQHVLINFSEFKDKLGYYNYTICNEISDEAIFGKSESYDDAWEGAFDTALNCILNELKRKSLKNKIHNENN